MKLHQRILFIALSVSLIGCNEQTPNGNNETKGYNVRLEINREVVKLDQGSPLQTIPNALESDSSIYGVQIYSRKDAAGTTYSPYAFGIFDDPSNINITLYERNLYKFAITKIVDGKTVLPVKSDDTFRSPLTVDGGGCDGTLSNKITISNSCVLSKIGAGLTELEQVGSLLPKKFAHPNIDRYYGELADFAPSESTSNPTIELRRVAFGINFFVEGLTQGHLDITLKDAPVIVFQYGQSDSTSHMFTLNGSLSDNLEWTKDYYKEEIPVSIKWHRSESDVVVVAEKLFTFQRKYEYNMKIKLSVLSFDKEAVITTEKDELIKGDDINIQ